jgi:hypothetical protein
VLVVPALVFASTLLWGWWKADTLHVWDRVWDFFIPSGTHSPFMYTGRGYIGSSEIGEKLASWNPFVVLYTQAFW